MADYLFVYGTLKPELASPEIAAVIRQFKRVGSGTIRGFLYDLGEYPGVRLDANGKEVCGEVFEFSDVAILSALDTYEGYEAHNPTRSLFVRKQCHVRLKENDGQLLCWVYEYNRQPASSHPIDAWPPQK